MTVPHAERPQLGRIIKSRREMVAAADAQAREAMAEITAAYNTLSKTIDAPTIADVTGPRQDRKTTALRRAFVYIMRERYDVGWSSMSRIINRDHATCMYLYQTALSCRERPSHPFCIPSNRWIFALTRALDAVLEAGESE